MDITSKGKSPFYPGQPVPSELFSGRKEQIEQIRRAISQVASGKQQMLFLQGEYGIGKSSLAGVMKLFAEEHSQLFGIHVQLGGAKTLEDVATRTLEVTLSTKAYQPSRTEKIRGFLAKYISEITLFGSINLNMSAIKIDAPSLANGFLPFLETLLENLKETGIKGIFLILDELNGITANKDFSYFIKSLVDQNALQKIPLPLLLMLCGVPERRQEMIRNHQPIDRIFEIVKIDPFSKEETKDFFEKAFKSVDMTIEKSALDIMIQNSDGYPKVMHIIGSKIYWGTQNSRITTLEAIEGVLRAAEEIGQQFVDEQILNALKSKDYKNILRKLVVHKFDLEFYKQDIEKSLNEAEKKKFHNFLQKMKKLSLLKAGAEKGQYLFSDRLKKIYIHMTFALKK